MRTYYRKAWEIVGYTYHADIYCAPCGETLPDTDPEGNNKSPVFVSDETTWEYEGEEYCNHCATCGEPSTEW